MTLTTPTQASIKDVLPSKAAPPGNFRKKGREVRMDMLDSQSVSAIVLVRIAYLSMVSINMHRLFYAG